MLQAYKSRGRPFSMYWHCCVALHLAPNAKIRPMVQCQIHSRSGPYRLSTSYNRRWQQKNARAVSCGWVENLPGGRGGPLGR